MPMASCKKSANAISSRLFAAGHDDLAGADGLDDVELREHRDGGVDLRAIAVDHDDHRGRCEVDGFAGEVFGDLQGHRAFLGRALDLDEHHFLGDRIGGGVLEAMDHIDELADLHDDLAEALRVAGDADGHAREVRVASFGNDE